MGWEQEDRQQKDRGIKNLIYLHPQSARYACFHLLQLRMDFSEKKEKKPWKTEREPEKLKKKNKQETYIFVDKEILWHQGYYLSWQTNKLDISVNRNWVSKWFQKKPLNQSTIKIILPINKLTK